MVHKQNATLQQLLSLLDDERNELFIHLDKKAGEIQQEFFATTNSRLHFIPRIKVEWGAYSQIKAELSLLKAAAACGKYDYYHLLSGEDLPLKSQDDLHQFFERHQGTEFMSFTDEFSYGYRVNYYYPLQSRLRRGEFGRQANSAFYRLQKLLKIKRNQKINFKSGSNWFSITDACARFVLAHERWIKRTFHHSFCADELFLQTLISSSDFLDKCYHSDFKNVLTAPYFTKNEENCLRFVDWNLGDPYVFRAQDFARLTASPLLFARKFDFEIDNEIIEKLAVKNEKI